MEHGGRRHRRLSQPVLAKGQIEVDDPRKAPFSAAITRERNKTSRHRRGSQLAGAAPAGSPQRRRADARLARGAMLPACAGPNAANGTGMPPQACAKALSAAVAERWR